MPLASSLSENDRKELNRSLGLPIKDKNRTLKYYYHANDTWKEYVVKDYEVIETLKPSGTSIVKIILENDQTINIHADYFAEMQKPSFLNSQDDREFEIEQFGDGLPKSYVVIDLETSGKNHLKDKIIEIGAIRYDKGSEVDRLSILVKCPTCLSSDIVKLTGITDQMLAEDGVEPLEAAKKLMSFIAGSIVVGHNFKTFDRHFIIDLYDEYLKKPFLNNFIDTLDLSKEKYPILPSHKLKELAMMYQIDYSKAHRAVEDCEINHQVYECLAFGKTISGIEVDNKSTDADMPEQDETDLLINLDENELFGWKKELNNALKSVIIQKGLPQGALVLKGNVGRKGNNITSYSICIYEPNLIEDTKDSSRNTIILRIANANKTGDILKLELKRTEFYDMLDIPEDAVLRRPMKSNWYVKIKENSNNLIPFLIKCVELSLKNYNSKEAKFACCARYKQCSEEGVCVHPNMLFSMACAYRKNLEMYNNFLKNN